MLAVPRDALNPLVAALESAGFYVPGVNDVVAGKMRTLQVTQVATISRADLVLADSNDYEQLKFQRRRLISLPNGTENIPCLAGGSRCQQIAMGQAESV